MYLLSSPALSQYQYCIHPSWAQVSQHPLTEIVERRPELIATKNAQQLDLWADNQVDVLGTIQHSEKGRASWTTCITLSKFALDVIFTSRVSSHVLVLEAPIAITLSNSFGLTCRPAGHYTYTPSITLTHFNSRSQI